MSTVLPSWRDVPGRALAALALASALALGACSRAGIDGDAASAPAPSASDATATIRNSIPGPRGDPSVPRADEVLPAQSRTAGPPPQTTAAGTQPMTRTQEQQQMPLPTQANDHSAVGNDKK
jgi:hypothetical protein